MDTVLSFLGALGSLGAIAHILVQDNMDKPEGGPLKNKINHHQIETDYHKFNNKMGLLKERFMLGAPTGAHKMMSQILGNGSILAESYVSKLIQDALPRD